MEGRFGRQIEILWRKTDRLLQRGKIDRNSPKKNQLDGLEGTGIDGM